MITAQYYVNESKADFMEDFLKNIGANYTRIVTKNNIILFAVESSSMRLHVLIDDVFDRVIEHTRRTLS